MQTFKAPLALEWAISAVSLAGGIAIAATGLGYGLTNTSGVGAGFFPLAAGSMMALAGVLWAAQLYFGMQGQAPGPVAADTELETVPPHHDSDSALVSLLDDDNSEEPEAEFPDRRGWIRVGIIAGSMLLAALLLPLLGYTIVMSLQLVTVLFLVSKRRLLVAAAVGIGASLASRLVFEVWLGTALPTSSIDFLAGLGM